MGILRAEVERVLESVGFVGTMRGATISSLSGGWKMKLALGEPHVSSSETAWILPYALIGRTWQAPAHWSICWGAAGSTDLM